MKICPQCRFEVSEAVDRCAKCGWVFSASSVDQNPAGTPAAPNLRSREPAGLNVVGRIYWVVALAVVVTSLVDYRRTIATAESAPQQAAGAAMTAVWLIGAYVAARALDEILGRGRV